MGTYNDSRYVIARFPRRCQAADCRVRAPGALIQRGEEYLVWKRGQRNQIGVCVVCSLKLENNGHPWWWCAAVVLRLRALAAAAKLKEASSESA